MLHPSLLFSAAVSTTVLRRKGEAESTNVHTFLKILAYLTSSIK